MNGKRAQGKIVSAFLIALRRLLVIRTARRYLFSALIASRAALAARECLNLQQLWPN